MGLSIDIVSIGTLSRNFFWDEAAPVRGPHATTTLIRDDNTLILVDPSLPLELLQHRLDERVGVKPEQIDVVFLSNFSPVHRRSLALFDAADWYISETERDTVAERLNAVLDGAGQAEADVSYECLEEELALLGRLRVVPEQLTAHVDWYPSYGATPGSSSLLVKAARTVVIAGDAIINRDYFDHGRVWDRSSDPEMAKESFVEIRGIADVIVPGHDNIMLVG